MPPLLLPSLGMALGIVLASGSGLAAAVWWFLLAAALAGAAVLAGVASRPFRPPGAGRGRRGSAGAAGAAWTLRAAPVTPAVGVAACLLAGSVAAGGLLLRAEETRSSAALRPLAGEEVRIRGTVAGEPAAGSGSVRFALAVDEVRTAGGGWVAARGRVLARVRTAGPAGGGDPAGVRPAYGDRVELAGRLREPAGPRNPGEAGEREWLRRQGIGLVLEGAAPGHLRVLARGRGSPAVALALALRRRMEGVIGTTLPEREAALLRSLVLGDREDLPPDLRDDFRRTGLVHVLSVSGLHVGFVAGALLLLLRPLRLGPRARAAAVVPALALYALLTGAGAPVVRAAVMLGCVLAARCLGRPGSGLGPLAAALAAILVARPSSLFDPGCQLSFAATAGILVAAPGLRAALAPLGDRWRVPGWVLGGLAVSLAAQAATLPLVLYHFGAVSPVSLAANLAAVPLAGAAVPLGFAGTLAGLAWLDAARVANRFTGLTLALLEEVVSWFAGWPWASVAMPRPSPWGAALSYAFLAWGWRAWTAPGPDPGGGHPPGGPRPGRRRRGVTAAVAAALACLALSVRFPAGGRWPVEAVFLDVGQGDAVVFHLPGGRTLVVDGGPPPRGGSPLARYLAYRGVRRVDVLVATHGDVDHVGGLAEVVRSVSVGEIWYGVAEGGPVLGELLERAGSAGARLRRVRRGQVLSPAPGVRVEVLNPRDPPLRGTPAPDNDNAVVLRLSYGEARFLLAADLEAAGEADLLAAGERLESAVLKVGHHGGRRSTGPAFLAAVRPRVAVIQVGPNAHGHPDPAVVGRLEALGAEVWRTDRSGAVTVGTDGRRLAVRGTRDRRATAGPAAPLYSPGRAGRYNGARG